MSHLLNVPRSSYPAIRSLVGLSAKDFDAFVEALSRAKPLIIQEKFWAQVAQEVPQIDRSVIESIGSEMFQIARMFRKMSMGADEGVTAVADSAASVKSEEFPITASDQILLKDRLGRIFKRGTGLSVAAKAMDLMLEQDRVFLSAKILSDIRPVFDEDVDKVEAAIIVHNLRIQYSRDNDRKEFCVALDTSDIQLLRDALDRADAKTKNLESFLKRSEVSFLDLEE